MRLPLIYFFSMLEKVRVQLESEKRIRVQLRPKLSVLGVNFERGSQ